MNIIVEGLINQFAIGFQFHIIINLSFLAVLMIVI
jgi:hypothetical protein